MFKSYLKIAFSNLWKKKFFSFINIMGLTIGLATSLLITLCVIDELSYDRYNVNADRIFRIDADILFRGTEFRQRNSPAQLGFVLMKDYPKIEKVFRLAGEADVILQNGNEMITEHNCTYADSTFFDVFTLTMLHGDPRTALVEPGTMVISESMAKKYFKSTDVVGKVLLTDYTKPYKITGVIKDMPIQSHIHLNFIKAMSELGDSRNDNWLSDNYHTYILVRPGTTEEELNGYLKAATQKYIEGPLKSASGGGLNDLEHNGGHLKYAAMPLTKIHLYSTLTNEAEPSGNKQYVYIFIFVAIFILIIACINFMNLSTARSESRSKEVGIRKVLGSGRFPLIAQFLTESLLTSFIALLLAVAFALLLLPLLNDFLGKKMTLLLLGGKWMVLVLLLTTVVVGLLAGSYPAFILSAFNPVQVLKGNRTQKGKRSWLRDGLVMLQFIPAIILIVGTLVIYNQLNYIKNKDLGYERSQVLVVKNTGALDTRAKLFKDRVLQIPGVKSGTMTDNLPTDENWSTHGFSKDADRSSGNVMVLGEWHVDTDYLPALEMKMAKGRNFSSNMPTDSTAMILNEAAEKLLSLDDPLSGSLYYGGKAYRVIGVVKDFNTGSLRTKIPPIAFFLTDARSKMAFRIDSKNITSIISKIKSEYDQMNASNGQPFMYSFLDEDFDRLYNAEQRMGKIFFSFAFLTIFITCLGLFGLVSFTTEQRVKEIGVRKVLGASVSDIVFLLSKDFLKLVIFAFIVAAPVSWFMMSKWLEGFAYRVGIDWWVFLVAAILAVMITIVTVSQQSIRAALTNPVKSLRAV